MVARLTERSSSEVSPIVTGLEILARRSRRRVPVDRTSRSIGLPFVGQIGRDLIPGFIDRLVDLDR